MEAPSGSQEKLFRLQRKFWKRFYEDNLLSPLKNTLLRLQKLLLQEKLDTIRNLDQEILAVFTDTQLDEGVCEVDEFT